MDFEDPDTVHARTIPALVDVLRARDSDLDAMTDEVVTAVRSLCGDLPNIAQDAPGYYEELTTGLIGHTVKEAGLILCGGIHVKTADGSPAPCHSKPKICNCCLAHKKQGVNFYVTAQAQSSRPIVSTCVACEANLDSASAVRCSTCPLAWHHLCLES
mmetsp:Transcript_29661/g.73486  ORF Transcript_29661/g.73486 Transcript_29661/m.73486 type:complete len:158 (+) Transcript_29661:278-751(+)